MSDLAPFSLPGRFWRGNLHTHSTLSDGALAPDQVVEAYKATGYDFMMLSEHFLKRYSWPVADTRKLRSNRFTTLIGAELHAPMTQVGELWHIVAAGLPLDFAPAEAGETGAGLARRAADSGAFVGIAHPAWSQLTVEDGRAIEVAHAVEIYNHGCAMECDRGDGWYLMDQLLNDGRRLTAFATDDAHFIHGEHDAFGGWVEVKSESLEPESLLAALKAGHYYASQGPRIHELAISGDELTIACSPVDSISVMGGTSRTANRIGRAITAATIDLGELERSWLPQQSRSPWLRVALVDARGRRAWTNPIWLDELA
jgi:hypothetical protein